MHCELKQAIVRTSERTSVWNERTTSSLWCNGSIHCSFTFQYPTVISLCSSQFWSIKKKLSRKIHFTVLTCNFSWSRKKKLTQRIWNEKEKLILFFCTNWNIFNKILDFTFQRFRIWCEKLLQFRFGCRSSHSVLLFFYIQFFYYFPRTV